MQNGMMKAALCGNSNATHMDMRKALDRYGDEQADLARLRARVEELEAFLPVADALRGHAADPEHFFRPTDEQVWAYDRARAALSSAGETPTR